MNLTNQSPECQCGNSVTGYGLRGRRGSLAVVTAVLGVRSTARAT